MTLIGNKREFAFELVPVTPSWERRYAPEKAAWAGTAIWVDGKNLCSHVRPGSSAIEEYLYIPLGPLVDWLVRAFPSIEFQERAPLFATTQALHQSADAWFDAHPPVGLTEDAWFDAREDWWSRHFLRAGSDGTLLPDLAFARNDEQLILDWATPRFVGPDAPMMLSSEGRFALPWDEGRLVLEELASTVARWLRENATDNIYAWVRYESPLRQMEPAIVEAIELFAGRSLTNLEIIFGVQEVDELLSTLHLDAASRDPAASPQCQILRDLSPVVSVGVRNALMELGDESAREHPDPLKRWHDARVKARDAARPAESPERAGYMAAAEIRNALSLNGQPILDVPATLTSLGLQYSHTDVMGGRDRMMVAARDDGMPVARTLRTLSTEKSWGQRFEACRALGHILLDPIRSGSLGAASGPFAGATRRRRSGAFAAEFLLPETALAGVSQGKVDGVADGSVFPEVLERFGIGARAAAYHLWNHGWLSNPDIRDELIEQYGATVPG